MTWVKICGVTRVDDAEVCVRYGVDALGLNFHPASPRCLTVHQARRIARVVPPFIPLFGIFVDHSPEEMQAISYEVGLQVVQTYPRADLPIAHHPFRHVPSFRVRSQDDLRAIKAYLGHSLSTDTPVSAVLVDSYVEGLHGGSGHIAPWGLLADFRPECPLILAGGLTPDNVIEAMATVRPAAVDVASGVESAPGIKDAGKIRAFIENVRRGSAPWGQ
jgi:phosphoribosylanthranilate isomerase